MRIAMVGLGERQTHLLGLVAQIGIFEGDGWTYGDVFELIVALIVGNRADAILRQVEGGVSCWQGVVEVDAALQVGGLLG